MGGVSHGFMISFWWLYMIPCVFLTHLTIHCWTDHYSCLCKDHWLCAHLLRITMVLMPALFSAWTPCHQLLSWQHVMVIYITVLCYQTQKEILQKRCLTEWILFSISFFISFLSFSENRSFFHLLSCSFIYLPVWIREKEMIIWLLLLIWKYSLFRNTQYRQ